MCFETWHLSICHIRTFRLFSFGVLLFGFVFFFLFLRGCRESSQRIRIMVLTNRNSPGVIRNTFEITFTHTVLCASFEYVIECTNQTPLKRLQGFIHGIPERW